VVIYAAIITEDWDENNNNDGWDNCSSLFPLKGSLLSIVFVLGSKRLCIVSTAK
jgi:hypothetical protein